MTTPGAVQETGGRGSPWRRAARWIADPWVAVPFAVASFIALRSLLGSYADLGIYFDVARELTAGGVDLYRAREGIGSFAYPTAVLLPFKVLLAALPENAVRALYALGLGAATAMIAVDLRAAARLTDGLRAWQWVALAVLFQRCVAQNLTHGQLSLWVSALTLRGCLRLATGRDIAAGVFLGAAAAMKLTPLAFVVALPLMGRLRTGAVTAATALAAVVLLPWPLLGTGEHCFQLANFHRAVLAPTLGLAPEASVLEFHQGASVAGTFDYLLQPRPVDKDGRAANVVALSDGGLTVVKVAWSALLLGILGLAFLRGRALPASHRLLHQCSLVMLAIALFSPLTRVYHLAGALLPALLFCRGPRRGDWLWWGTALALLFTMTLRQKNLLGETLWRSLDHLGVLHFALVGVLCWLAVSTQRQPSTRSSSSRSVGA